MRTGRRIAFDVGQARVGVAISDVHAILSTPIEHLNRRDASVFVSAKELVELSEAIEVYVGLPVNLQSQNTLSTLDAIEFANQLQGLVAVEVRLVDERFSTKIASGSLRESGKNSKSQRNYIDSASAAVILETALDHERKTGQATGVLVSEIENEK